MPLSVSSTVTARKLCLSFLRCPRLLIFPSSNRFPGPEDTPQSAASVVTMATPFFVSCPTGSAPVITGHPALNLTTTEPTVGAMISIAPTNASALASFTGTVYCGFARFVRSKYHFTGFANTLFVVLVDSVQVSLPGPTTLVWCLRPTLPTDRFVLSPFKIPFERLVDLCLTSRRRTLSSLAVLLLPTPPFSLVPLSSTLGPTTTQSNLAELPPPPSLSRRQELPLHRLQPRRLDQDPK